MKKLLITLSILILLTIITALFSSSNVSYTTIVILILAVLKFVGVAFYFMEMRKAHVFWKVSIAVFLVMFTTLIIL